MSSSEAKHEFGALNTLLLVVILGLCILSAYLIKQNSFYYLPESGAAILVGMIVGGLAKAVYPSTEELTFLTFEPELFFFLLLPPIIFEAGYSLKKRDFFANFWSITLFAVFGTIISTFVIGFLVYAAGYLGWVDIDISSPMEALIFGSLLSAVDPVATLSIMGNPELNCDPLLYSLVFGESVLNDAVAIVLFKTFSLAYESGEDFSSSTIPAIMTSFTLISLGSVFVGVFTGLLCSYLGRHTQMKKYPEYEISILFLFAYGSYSFSESLQLSGIMSLFFSGIVLSHYNTSNLSSVSQVTAHNIFKALAVLSEFFVFLFLGMGLFTGKFKRMDFRFFLLSTLFCLISRVFNIFPLSFLANLARTQKISLQMQGVMWFAGLRGAISFALSQNMPGERRDLYISTTLSIVIFTTVVCGGLTEPMMGRMGMKTGATQGQQHGSSNGNSATIADAGKHGLQNHSPKSNGSAAARFDEEHAALSSIDQDEVADRVESSSTAGADGKALATSHFTRASRKIHHNLTVGKGFLLRFEREVMQPLFGGPTGATNRDEQVEAEKHSIRVSGARAEPKLSSKHSQEVSSDDDNDEASHLLQSAAPDIKTGSVPSASARSTGNSSNRGELTFRK